VTSREALAVGVVAAPALGAVLVALAPRRALTAVATGAALVTCALAIALAAVALTAAALVATFRFRIGMLRVIGACAGLGAVIRLLGG